MALKNGAFSVTTSAQLLVSAFNATAQAPVNVVIDNTLGTQNVFWGGATVTNTGATIGCCVPPGVKDMPVLYAGDDLYIVGAANCTIAFVAGRQ